ncbi:MAG: hypothetical protein Fur0010_25520 [Bdellovibrio sp.]
MRNWLILILLLSFNSFAQYREGDVLLLSLRCYVCPLMEQTTSGPYSHSGILMNINGTWMVAQALGKVHLVEVHKFLSQKREGTTVAQLRPVEFIGKKLNLSEIFFQEFYNLSFDGDYLWNNYDQNGNEKYYCSEFVAKFLNLFLKNPLLPSPMDFSYDFNLWRQVLGKWPPQGELGNSPNSFYFSNQFQIVEEN